MKQKSDFRGPEGAPKGASAALAEAKPRYCLYARKSTESEKRELLGNLRSRLVYQNKTVSHLP